MWSTIMVNPIRYVGFWNQRTSNCQAPVGTQTFPPGVADPSVESRSHPY